MSSVHPISKMQTTNNMGRLGANTQRPLSCQPQKPRKYATNFQYLIIAAVYADQLLQKRRENNLIVPGSYQSQALNDKANTLHNPLSS